MSTINFNDSVDANFTKLMNGIKEYDANRDITVSAILSAVLYHPFMDDELRNEIIKSIAESFDITVKNFPSDDEDDDGDTNDE